MDTRTKRGGNNHFGSTGILKCLTCRKRKGKVPSLPNKMFFADCASANITTPMSPVDSAQIVHCHAEKNYPPRAQGHMNYPSNWRHCNERQGWFPFPTLANYLQSQHTWNNDIPTHRSERSMQWQNPLLRTQLQFKSQVETGITVSPPSFY